MSTAPKPHAFRPHPMGRDFCTYAGKVRPAIRGRGISIGAEISYCGLKESEHPQPAPKRKARRVVLGKGWRVPYGSIYLLTWRDGFMGLRTASQTVRNFGPPYKDEPGTLIWEPDPPKAKRGKR